jgi:predicted pyridoxine 5'-phosphate oxidase superfamily flavin-nucleotide-binding protein
VGLDELIDVARSIVDSNRYMTLATADESGRPWASPVWFAHAGYTE